MLISLRLDFCWCIYNGNLRICFYIIKNNFFHCNTLFALTKVSKISFLQRCYFNSAAAFLHIFKTHFVQIINPDVKYSTDEYHVCLWPSLEAEE